MVILTNYFHSSAFYSLFEQNTSYDLAVGEYLALTGEKLNGVDMLAVGLATNYSMSDVCSLTPFLEISLFSF